jgi:hypothetical protein
MPLPTPSRALFSMPATCSAGFFPDLEAAEVRSANVSSRRLVLLRRHASNMSSLGDAPLYLSARMQSYCYGDMHTSSSAMLEVYGVRTGALARYA